MYKVKVYDYNISGSLVVVDTFEFLFLELAESRYNDFAPHCYHELCDDDLVIRSNWIQFKYIEWLNVCNDLEQDTDCGDVNNRYDFSYFAGLDDVISFEDMLELESEYA